MKTRMGLYLFFNILWVALFSSVNVSSAGSDVHRTTWWTKLLTELISRESFSTFSSARSILQCGSPGDCRRERAGQHSVGGQTNKLRLCAACHTMSWLKFLLLSCNAKVVLRIYFFHLHAKCMLCGRVNNLKYWRMY